MSVWANYFSMSEWANSENNVLNVSVGHSKNNVLNVGVGQLNATTWNIIL
jgi:hypothetical protein